MKLLPVAAALGALIAATATLAPSARAGDPLDPFRLLGSKLSADQLLLNGFGFFGALLAALPPVNTVSIQIGDSPAQTSTGLGPQTLSLTSGNVSANASAGPGGASVSVTMSNPTNSMTMNASAGLGGSSASVHSGS